MRLAMTKPAAGQVRRLGEERRNVGVDSVLARVLASASHDVGEGHGNFAAVVAKISYRAATDQGIAVRPAFKQGMSQSAQAREKASDHGRDLRGAAHRRQVAELEFGFGRQVGHKAFAVHGIDAGEQTVEPRAFIHVHWVATSSLEQFGTGRLSRAHLSRRPSRSPGAVAGRDDANRPLSWIFFAAASRTILSRPAAATCAGIS